MSRRAALAAIAAASSTLVLNDGATAAENKGPKKPPPKTNPPNPAEKPEAKATEIPPPALDCETCRGLGMVPLKNPKPYVFVEGMPQPKPADSVPGAFCPKCRAGLNEAALVEVEAARLKGNTAYHKTWEERYGSPLVYGETRHATLHSLLDARESQKIGLAVEALCALLQKLTGSLELTLTRPDNFNLFLLWEKPSYDRFRAMLEKHLPAAQLGTAFAMARDFTACNVAGMPHFYETPITARVRPPVHGALSFFGRQQITTATNYRSPTWLSEGFPAYCEYAILRNVQWYSVYNPRSRPELGDSLAIARRLAAGGKLQRLEKFLPLELKDYEAGDYPQAFSVVAYLLNTGPSKFLDYLRHLRGGTGDAEALEKAYGTKLADLEGLWAKSLAGGR